MLQAKILKHFSFGSVPMINEELMKDFQYHRPIKVIRGWFIFQMNKITPINFKGF